MFTNNTGSLELHGKVLPMKREPAIIYNTLNKHALSVVKHIPYNMAPVILSFIARTCNNGSVKIIGKRVHELWVYGTRKYLGHLEDMV